MAADTFVVIGTTVARRVCSSLAQRGHEVRHVPGPDDDELRESLDGTSVRGIAILLQDNMDALRYALAAAHIHPSAPMMVTIFDRTIGDQLARFLPHCDVTSPADLAAPSLAGPCIQPGLLAVTRAGDLPRGIRTAGAVLDEVPVTVRARRGWRTWPMQVAGLWRSHEGIVTLTRCRSGTSSSGASKSERGGVVHDSGRDRRRCGPGDLVPSRKAAGHHLPVLGCRQPVRAWPKVRRDRAERGEEPSAGTVRLVSREGEVGQDRRS